MIDTGVSASNFRMIVAEQIRDALNHLDAVGEGLDAWQSDMLARAVVHLELGDHALAQDAAFRACRRSVFLAKDGPAAHVDGRRVTSTEVRAELERVMADCASRDRKTG